MGILNINHVSYSYHTLKAETNAIENISFDVSEGEFLGIIGPSGCGKTTLLNLLAGIISPSKGEIILRGKKISDAPFSIGLMPQRDQLFPWRTIEKNIMIGPELRNKKRKEDKVFARELLTKYGLKDFKNKYPSELSGGMRQRAALIRTLVIQPSILLLDEPFSALDFQTRLSVCNDVHSIIKQEKKTAILVSHDISESISLCDKIVVLSSRPAKVLKIITVDLDKNVTPLERRECNEFSQYFREIWNLLEEK